MKKALMIIVGLFVFVSSQCVAQIKSMDVAPAKPKKNIPVFDSTKNYIGEENVESYTGQKLLSLKNRSNGLDKYFIVDSVVQMDYTVNTLGDVTNQWRFYLTDCGDSLHHITYVYAVRSTASSDYECSYCSFNPNRSLDFIR